MRKYILIYLIMPACFGWAQDASNLTQASNRVPNPDFFIDLKGTKLELIPDRRALTTSKHNQMNRATGSLDEALTPKKLGVLINHNTGVEIATTGEITFKLKSGVAQESLQTLMLPNFMLVMKPDIYVIKASTPRQMIKIARQLNASPLIEWAELFTIPANLN